MNTWVPVHGELPRWSAAVVPPTLKDVAMRKRVKEVAYGWPRVCLFSRVKESNWRQIHEWSLAVPGKPTMRLPSGIIVSGSIINSVTFGLPFGIAILTIRWARAAKRVRNGQCRYCAYPVGMSQCCPECGRPVGITVSDE